MGQTLLFVAVCLTVYRLTRLVAVDRVTAPVRDRLQDWFERRWQKRQGSYQPSDEWQSMLAYLLGCMWCASIWVGGLVVLAIALTVGLPVPWWLMWLSASAVTGWLATNEGD